MEIIHLLKRNQDELFDLIKKKDLEVAEYILEGGDITHSWYAVTVIKLKAQVLIFFRKY